MSILVAAALAASSPIGLANPARQSAQASATVRILPAVRLRVGADRAESGELLKATTIPAANGSRIPAKLVEFE
jgi:hypothetical protein